MTRIYDANALREPVEAGNHRQSAQRVHRNGMPGVRVVLVCRKRGENSETTQNMRMPADGVMGQGPRGFRENYREGDEGKRLPEFGHFKPNEQSDDSCARGSKKAAQSSLLRIVPVRGQLGREIERCSENGQSQETHAHVRVFGGFQVQIDNRRTIESDEPE